MRHSALSLLLLLLLTFHAIAQKPGDDYVFTADYYSLMSYNPATNNTESTDTYLARRGQIFSISIAASTTDKKSGFYITFWPFKNATKQEKPFALKGPATKIIDSSSASGRVFFISSDDLKNDATTLPKLGLAVSADGLVLPIKLRFHNKQPNGDFSFEQSISVGPAISYTHRVGKVLSGNTGSIMFGFNITNVSVDSGTVPKIVTSKTTEMGLTPFLGYSLVVSGVNISLISGFDILTGKAESAWVYRKSPWLGVSVGVSLFATKKTGTVSSDVQSKTPAGRN